MDQARALRGAAGTLEVVVVTELPRRVQEVWEIHTGKPVDLTNFLIVPSTNAMLDAFRT